MGIGMVLLAAAVVGTVMASVGGAVFGGAAAWFTKGVQHGRRTAVLVAAAFPFACLAWGGLVFAFQAIVNETVLHRDVGLGDAWECPLPNGYAVLMIDVTDHGFVYNPKTQTEGDVIEQEDAPYGVRLLQVDTRYIVGGVDSKPDEEAGTKNHRVDSYFLLDTHTGRRTTFSDYKSLRAAADQLGIQLKLEPIKAIYSRYRFTWFDTVTDLLFAVPPLTAFILLLLWIRRVRKRNQCPSIEPTTHLGGSALIG
jgi:hypothetical protein